MSVEQESSIPDQVSRLPVQKIFLKGLFAPFVYYRELIKSIYPLFIIYSVLIFVSPSGPENTSEAPYVITWIFFSVFLWVFMLAAIVGCHRVFVLGPDSIRGKKIVWFSGSQWRLIGWYFATGLVCLPFVIPFYFLLDWNNFLNKESILSMAFYQSLIYLPATYVLSRLALLYPAAATNYLPELTLSWAWGLSRSNHLQLFLLIGVIPTLTNIVFQFFMILDSVFVSILGVIIYIYVVIAELAILSFSFSYLVQDRRD